MRVRRRLLQQVIDAFETAASVAHLGNRRDDLIEGRQQDISHGGVGHENANSEFAKDHLTRRQAGDHGHQDARHGPWQTPKQRGEWCISLLGIGHCNVTLEHPLQHSLGGAGGAVVLHQIYGVNELRLVATALKRQ